MDLKGPLLIWLIISKNRYSYDVSNKIVKYKQNLVIKSLANQNQIAFRLRYYSRISSIQISFSKCILKHLNMQSKISPFVLLDCLNINNGLFVIVYRRSIKFPNFGELSFDHETWNNTCGVQVLEVLDKQFSPAIRLDKSRNKMYWQ